jgi:hypothetical protein
LGCFWLTAFCVEVTMSIEMPSFRQSAKGSCPPAWRISRHRCYIMELRKVEAKHHRHGGHRCVLGSAKAELPCPLSFLISGNERDHIFNWVMGPLVSTMKCTKFINRVKRYMTHPPIALGTSLPPSFLTITPWCGP